MGSIGNEIARQLELFWSRLISERAIPAGAIRDQLNGAQLPPTGNTGQGYTPDPNAVTRVQVRKNSGGSTYARRRLNFIAAGGVAIALADDGANEEVDITISGAAGGGGSLSVTDGTTTVSSVSSLTFSGATVTNLGGGVAGVTVTGGGGTPSHAYYTKLAALLEPDAIEPLQRGSFSYTVSGTKYLLQSWATRVGGAGRMEVRDPHTPMALRGVTLSGLGSTSSATLLDPTLPTYADAWTTYYDRLNTLAESNLRTLNLTTTNQTIPFLPGPYGAIVTRAVNFGFAWIIIYIAGTYGPNLANEISDSATQRNDNALLLPVWKGSCNELLSSSAGEVGAAGTITYVLLPNTWSKVADPLSYTFRDDFMGASLNTGATWTRVQTNTGDVEIDTQYQWCRVKGNNSAWGNDGLYRQTGTTRANNVHLLMDIYCGRSGSGAIYGWSNGGGQSYTNFSHGVHFGSSNLIQVYENGNNRGNVGSGWVAGAVYRIRITLAVGGSATYEMQSTDGNYPAIGSASWTNITPGTSISPDNTLRPGASSYALDSYISDVRIY